MALVLKENLNLHQVIKLEFKNLRAIKNKTTKNMKKTILMSALLLAGAAFVQPSVAAISSDVIEISMQEEKVQINPNDLPDAVKATIAADESLQGAAVSEAWKITKEDDSVHFQVIFTSAEGEKTTKTYDPDGNEIKE
jgi:hypothetical protein